MKLTEEQRRAINDVQFVVQNEIIKELHFLIPSIEEMDIGDEEGNSDLWEVVVDQMERGVSSIIDALVCGRLDQHISNNASHILWKARSILKETS
jgi:hypothetical protein